MFHTVPEHWFGCLGIIHFCAPASGNSTVTWPVSHEYCANQELGEILAIACLLVHVKKNKNKK